MVFLSLQVIFLMESLVFFKLLFFLVFLRKYNNFLNIETILAKILKKN